MSLSLVELKIGLLGQGDLGKVARKLQSSELQTLRLDFMRLVEGQGYMVYDSMISVTQRLPDLLCPAQTLKPSGKSSVTPRSRSRKNTSIRASTK